MTHEMMGWVHHKTAQGCMIPINLSYLVKIQYFRGMGLATGQEVLHCYKYRAGCLATHKKTKESKKPTGTMT